MTSYNLSVYVIWRFIYKRQNFPFFDGIVFTLFSRATPLPSRMRAPLIWCERANRSEMAK